MGNLKARFKTWLVIIVAGLLTSCGSMFPILSTETELTLGEGEKWAMQYVIVLPVEASIVAQEYQASLNDIVSEMNSKGIIASWEMIPQGPNNTNISYRLKFSGSGYGNLNAYIFENPSSLTSDPNEANQVKFNFDPRLSLISQGQHNTFTLNSSKILSSNGIVVDTGSVQWVDPTTMMTAVVSTAPDRMWLWIVLLIVGGIGFIVAGLGVSGKLSTRQHPMPVTLSVDSGGNLSKSISNSEKFCPKCGTSNPLEAGFCIKCGIQFPSQ